MDKVRLGKVLIDKNESILKKELSERNKKHDMKRKRTEQKHDLHNCNFKLSIYRSLSITVNYNLYIDRYYDPRC